MGRKRSAGSRVGSGARRREGRRCVRRQFWPSLRNPDTPRSRTDLTRPYISPCSTDKVSLLLGNSSCKFDAAFPLATTASYCHTAEDGARNVEFGCRPSFSSHRNVASWSNDESADGLGPRSTVSIFWLFNCPVGPAYIARSGASEFDSWQ